MYTRRGAQPTAVAIALRRRGFPFLLVSSLNMEFGTLDIMSLLNRKFMSRLDLPSQKLYLSNTLNHRACVAKRQLPFGSYTVRVQTF